MKRICGTVIFITLLPLVVCASPHHAFAAEYDADKQITVKGTITKVDFVNPHSWLYVNVKDADGKLVNWAIEMGPPHGLMRRGVHKDSVPVGLEVTVEGYCAKDGTSTVNGTTILLPDGRHLFTGSSAPGAEQQ